jgi:acetylornithine deacetylase/succinyl-diaminopimelate desuccinylase family protein
MTVSEDDLVALTGELVNRESENPPGNEAAVAAYLVERLESAPVDFEIEVRDVEPDRPNVVARAGDPAGGTLLLTGHTDVVPADPADWSSPPYELTRRDGRVVGRGTSDMKGALAAKLAATEEYLGSGGEGEVVLAFVVGEEAGGLGSAALVEDGIDADGAIVGEPTDLQVGVAEKGVARYRVHTGGRAAHSGRPDQGVSALDRMRVVLDRIDDLNERIGQHHHDLLTDETATVTEIEGGLAPNIVPDAVEITLDWRTLPGRDLTSETFDAELEAALADLAMDGQPFEAEVEPISFGRASETDPDSPLVEATLAGAAEAGVDAELVGFNAITDARYFRLDADIPTVLFGPGTIEDDAHTVDESIDVADLVATARTYRATMEQFLGR